MFDLEKFRTGDYYVHLPTYELYIKVIEWLDDEGFRWGFGEKLYEYNAWDDFKVATCISCKYDGSLFVGHVNIYDQVYDELELNIEKTNLHIGDEVRVNVSRGIFDSGDVGYIAHVSPGVIYPYLVVKDESLVGVGLVKLHYDNYDLFRFSELEKLHSHEEVKEQLGLGNNEKHYTKLMLENKSIYLDKNEKYGDAFAETIQKYGYISALTRMNDKFNRIEEFTLKGFTDEEESLRDSLMDLANYCYMYVMEIEKENEDE